MANLFKKPEYTFFWKDIKTYLIRSQYNELLHFVVKEYFGNQYKTLPLPRFLDTNYALTLSRFDESCSCESPFEQTTTSKGRTQTAATKIDGLRQTYLKAENDYFNTKDLLTIARRDLAIVFENFEFEKPAGTPADELEVQKLKPLITDQNKAIDDAATRNLNNPLTGTIVLKGLVNTHSALGITTAALKEAVVALKTPITNFETEINKFNAAQDLARKAKHNFEKAVKEVNAAHENAIAKRTIAYRTFELDPSSANEMKKAQADIDEKATGREAAAINRSYATSTSKNCVDIEANYFCAPDFTYIRKRSLDNPPANFDINFDTHGLTVGSVIWLYHYERMGIFKILGALLDDYNYRGKYTISGSRDATNAYSTLMDMICTLHRLGISSNLRDRICTYQRVLGVTIQNNLGIESERNTGFMQTFNKLLDYMLEYYKAKQLAQAIQSQNGTIQPRSSVATQTSILDTLNLMQQQFEPMQYGRNQINTFLGIATVHATICLVKMLKAEIGIPAQYEKPEEFIPAAYDILIAKRPVTLNETNRFIIHDNCASYGYRLLTDIETADINQFTAIASGATLDVWLNDVEGWVEGYRNAYASVPEGAEAMI